MKILSKKKYNKLYDDCEKLQEKVEELKRINESLGEDFKQEEIQ
uniref:DASH complex subunit Dam1 n=1 Tax=virus sp. ctQ5V6 TaxID=2825815 RepID=A0A8S5RQ19_9VIRU|nr:MAG TPA: DASH complex subunit Dam1 [virus sp. ctQ5V6]